MDDTYPIPGPLIAYISHRSCVYFARYRPGDADRAAATPPATTLVFDACKHEAVLGKLMSFNSEVRAASMTEL